MNSITFFVDSFIAWFRQAVAYYKFNGSYPSSVVLQGDPYEDTLVRCLMAGLFEGFATVHVRKGTPTIYLDGVMVMFTHKRCWPVFVLDQIEYLDPMRNHQMNKFNLNTKRGLASAFRHAANTLDKYGWVQGDMGNSGMGYCAMGALSTITGGFGKEYIGVFKKKKPAIDGLLKSLGCPTHWGNSTNSCRRTVETSIIHYNDGLGQTKEGVQRFFRKIASGLEHGGVL